MIRVLITYSTFPYIFSPPMVVGQVLYCMLNRSEYARLQCSRLMEQIHPALRVHAPNHGWICVLAMC